MTVVASHGASDRRGLIDVIRLGWDEAGNQPTPYCYFSEEHLRSVLAFHVAAATACGFTLAFSVKTNPTRSVLRLARASGLLAETTNVAEVQASTAAGWRHEQIVLNGPGKCWPTGALPAGLLCIVADTIEELARSAEGSAVPQFLGLRIRPPGVKSRFGVDITESGAFDKAVVSIRRAAIRGHDFAVHAHFNSVACGLASWWGAMKTVIDLAARLESTSRIAVLSLNLGGGWDRHGLDRLLVDKAGEVIVATVKSKLTSCRMLLLEPGHSVLADSGAVYTRVLSRDRPDELIVDASVAEVPFSLQQARPVFRLRSNDNWVAMAPGSGTIFGRTCMETDELVRGLNVSGIEVGDVLALGETGSYDTSMRFRFADGGKPPALGTSI